VCPQSNKKTHGQMQRTEREKRSIDNDSKRSVKMDGYQNPKKGGVVEVEEEEEEEE
jgi:hypothetical protein